MTHTKDQLAEALCALGLQEMASKASSGWYHDYISPLPTPTITLVDDLAVAASKSPNSEQIMALRRRVMDGDFDASTEESDEWAKSPEGQDAFSRLTRK